MSDSQIPKAVRDGTLSMAAWNAMREMLQSHELHAEPPLEIVRTPGGTTIRLADVGLDRYKCTLAKDLEKTDAQAEVTNIVATTRGGIPPLEAQLDSGGAETGVQILKVENSFDWQGTSGILGYLEYHVDDDKIHLYQLICDEDTGLETEGAVTSILS